MAMEELPIDGCFPIKASLYTGFSSQYRPRIIRQPIFFGEAPRAFHPAPTTAAVLPVSSPAWDEGAKQLTMWLGISQVSRATMVNPQLPMLDLWWLFHYGSILLLHWPSIRLALPNFRILQKKTAPTWWSSSFTFWQIVIILKLETCCHFGNCFELSGDDFVNHLELRQFLVICQIPTWTALPFSRSRYIYI